MSTYNIAQLKWHKSYLPKSEHDINGVIHKRALTKVFANASSVLDDDYNNRNPNNVINASSNRWWTSKDEDSQYIIINISQRFFITNYSVQSINLKESNQHAKQWKLEGIDTKGESYLLDEVTESKINGELFVETRPVTNATTRFTSFKITSTGNNWGTVTFRLLRFYKIDFFGIIETNHIYCTRQNQQLTKSYLITIIILMIS